MTDIATLTTTDTGKSYAWKYTDLKRAAEKMHGPEPPPTAEERQGGNPYLARYLRLIKDTEDVATNGDSEIAPCARYDRRREMIKVFSWAIPNDAAIRLLRRHSPLIEIGAGTGYWAWMVEQEGGIVLTYDSWQAHFKTETRWMRVKRGGPAMIKYHPEATLFLCWPPYDEPMAHTCPKNYSGEFFLYEGEDSSGCTGDDNFHDELNTHWKLKRKVAVPKWSGIHDSLFLYQRNGKG